MSEDVNKNNDNDSKKLWLWLLLLLLLIIFVVIAVIIFFRDSGTADALDNTISNEIVNGQDGKNQLEDDNDEEDTTSNVVAVVNTADKKVVIASPGVGSATNSGTTVQKQTVKVNVDDESYFNEPVVLEIAGNEYTATITDSDGNTTKYSGKTTISEDGTYTLTIKETDGNETTVTFVVDTTAPEIKGVEEKLYNTEVSPEVEEINLEEVALTKDGSEVEYSLGDVIGEDGEYTLKVTDKAGNEASISFAIDRTAPTYTVEYSIIEPTNQDVVATIIVNESIQEIDGWIKVSDTTYTKTFTENAEENVTLKDEAGNEVTVNVKVDNIDKVAPVVTVKKNITSMTKKSVTVRITANEQIELPDNTWEYDDGTKMVIKKVYRQNIETDVVVKDLVGNEATAHIKITNIDKTAPTGNVTSSNNNGQWSTNQDVTATLVVSEPIKPIDGWTKVDEYTYTKVYSSNQKVTVEFEDLVGNKGKAFFEIKRIDKEPPVVTIISPNKYKMEVNTPYIEKGYSAEDAMDKDVTNRVTKKYQFQAKGTSNWEVVNDIDTSKLGVYKITYIFTDKAGNEATGTRVVEVVDTTAPVIALNGEKEINFLEKGVDTYTELGAKATDNYDSEKTLDKPEYINFYVYNAETNNYDFKGRVAEVDVNVPGRYNLVYTAKDSNNNEAVKVTRIVFVKDTITPTATVSYSTTDLTNKDVVVTINANENVKVLNAGTWNPASGYGTTFKKAYNKNTTQVVTLIDESGNMNTVEVKIENIDKIIPTALVSYNITEKTNSNVIVTLEASENVMISNAGAWNPASGYGITFKKVYNKNITQFVTLTDEAGNVNAVEIKIENIDKDGPVATVSYSTESSTNKDVIVTLTTDENAMISNAGTWNPATGYGTTFKKVYNKNTTQVVTLTDELGNTSTVEVKIENIDKESATVEFKGIIEGNSIEEMVAVQRIIASEPVEVIGIDELVEVPGSNNTIYEYRYSLRNGNMNGFIQKTVSVKDNAGNITDTPIIIFIPNYVDTTTTMRMIKSVRPVVSTESTTSVVEEDKKDDVVETTPVAPVVEEDKKDDNVETTPATPVVEEDKKDDNVETTPATPVVEEGKKDDNVETTPSTPVVEEDKKDDNIETTPATPVVEEGQNNDNGVDEEVVLTPEEPVAEEVMNPIVTDSEITE